jgi:hypothetical protein
MFMPLADMPVSEYEHNILKDWVKKNGMPDKLPDIKLEIAQAYAVFDEFIKDKFINEVNGRTASALLSLLVKDWLKTQTTIGENLYEFPYQYDKIKDNTTESSSLATLERDDKEAMAKAIMMLGKSLCNPKNPITVLLKGLATNRSVEKT